MNINTLPCERVEEIQETFQITRLCAKVLASKGLDDEEITQLLKPPVLCDPFSAKGMKAVVDRIYQAKQQQQKVLVCGDYDADGICSTTILVDALKRYGVTCGFYIPNRLKEGYGLSANTVRMAHEKGYQLLITVDNGVKAFAALEYANEVGLDVIVTDHHTMDEEVPCLYLLHPFTMGESFATLSGAGVALEISRALLGEIREHVVFACVAAIADVMPLQKETRSIVRLGIQYLKQGVCQPIIQLANDRYPQWDEVLIAYQIVPKLNVTGRLADLANANNTVKYLLLTKLEDIQQMSSQITALNDQRKVMSAEMVELAKSLVHPEYSFQLLFHDSFHEGMVGLIAGKLSEELHQPVMVAARNKEQYKGSIRSGGLLDLNDFFNDCLHHLDSYGGHKAAAGIGFAYDKKQLVQDYVNTRMEDMVLQDEHSYEVIQGTVDDLVLSQVASLRELAPFGQGFAEPIFLFENLPVQKMQLMSHGLHAKWTIDGQCEAMMFSCGERKDTLHAKAEISFIGNLRVNTFMGRKKVNIFTVEAY